MTATLIVRLGKVLQRSMLLLGALVIPTAASAESFEFELPAPDGKTVAIAPQSGVQVTVVCFLGTECPVVQLYSERLSELAAGYADKGVRFVGVISNRQDSLDDIRVFVERVRPEFPVVRDDQNRVADLFRAERTPEVIVLDHSFKVRYRGRVDDQFSPGVSRNTPSRSDLRIALEELLRGEAVAVPETKAVGCLIGKVQSRTLPSRSPTATTGDDQSRRAGRSNEVPVTFHKHISRVLLANCTECHRKGDIGPFSLTSYDEVVGWADTILEVVNNGRMPPWHADPQIGRFANARVMPESDRQLLRDWIAGGKLAGDAADAPEIPDYSVGWQLPREPNQVVMMRERPYRVPAQGTVDYQYFVVDPGFKEDRWVTAAQIIPGNRSVVHHAIAFVRPPDGSRFRGVGWLTAYVPGQRLAPLPTGYARKIPANSKIVFQMHYTTNGTAQDDLTRVGIVFGKPEDVTHELITVIGLDQEFEIPPNAAHHEVTGEVRWFPREGHLLALMPHMHYRGKSFRLEALRDDSQPGSSVLPLLNVPRYDFNWQHSYVLKDPIPLSNVRALTFTAVFDNSSANPFNPDPTQWVNWGDQTWEEMAVAFLEVAEPIGTSKSNGTGLTTGRRGHSGDGLDDAAKRVAREKKIQQFVDDFFRTLDKNSDGLVFRSEVPTAVRPNFYRFDRNDDEQATREEVRQLAEERFRD